MATNYSPTIVTDGAVFVGDALMPSTATSINGATKLYNRAGSSSDGTMYTGTCVDLDGTDDYIDLGSIAFGTKNISIALWFTIDAFDDDYACIFCNRTSSTGNVGFEIRQRTSGTKIELQFDWGSSSNNVETGALSTGTWHHMVATLDRSGYLRGYLNGVEFGSPLDISSQSATSITSDQSAKIGKDAYSNYWNGVVANCMIWEAALTAKEVKDIYIAQKGRFGK